MTRAGSADSGTSDHQSEGGGANPTPALGKAHQRLIRERRAGRDSDADLFGRWWQGIDLDIGRARVREISYLTAEKVILDYEWLGTMPAGFRHAFGIYFDGHLGGVAVYSNEYSENLGWWDKYGYTGKMALLSRGACVHWAHPHAASKLTRWSVKLLPTKYEVVTATVDRRAGEVGTIYQACGFHYVGRMRDVTGASHQVEYFENGRRVSQRTLRERYGTDANIPAHIVPGVARNKERYFAFRGAGAGQHLAAIAHLVKPYPKRAA